MRTAIKKVVALAAGATLVGSTLVGAMAADLASWPSPFVVKDATGKPSFDAMLVVGDQAAPADIIGITDIAISLQYQMIEEKEVSGSESIELTGDSFKVEKSSNLLEFNESLSSVASSVTGADLALLEDGEFTNEYGDYSYTQTIYLPADAQMEFTTDPDDSSLIRKPYFKISSGATVYKYRVQFSPAIKSDHNTGGNGYLEDIRNKKITLLGQTYTILNADHESGNRTSLTLMGGAVTDVIDEGETKTYSVGGEEYEVTASYISGSEAKMKVNGELTDSLSETETYKLKDATEIGIIDILAQNLAGEVDRLEFSLGANKLKLEDTDTATENQGGTITVGSSQLNSVSLDIITSQDQGTAAGNDVQISQFVFNYTSGDDLYLDVDELASVEADAAESQTGTFLLGAFDYKFGGLQTGSNEEIKLYPSGSNNYKVKFTNKMGATYDFNAFANNGGTIQLGYYTGSEVRDLVIMENETISKNEWFVTVNNDDKVTRVWKFVGIDVDTAGDNAGSIRIRDEGTGQEHEVTFSGLTGEFNMDGKTFNMNVSAESTSGTLWVDMDGSGTIGTSKVNTFWTQYGGNFSLGNHVNESLFQFTTEKDEDNVYDDVQYSLTINSDDELDIRNDHDTRTGSYTETSLQISEESSNLYQGYTNYGLFLEMDRRSSTESQNILTLTYPDNQAGGAFFVVGGETTKTVTSGEGTTQVIHKINVGATKLASSVSDVTAQNLIVVGGPCANAVAAELMGNPEPCRKDFEAGKAMIKLYEASTGKVAMLVAGYEAVDTTRATKVVADASGAKLKALTEGVKEVSVNTINEEPSIDVATP